MIGGLYANVGSGQFVGSCMLLFLIACVSAWKGVGWVV